MITARLAAAPMPWTFGPDGAYRDDESTLRAAAAGIREAGYTAMSGDAPAAIGSRLHREILAEHGLVRAPGYFRADLGDAGLLDDGSVLDDACRHAAKHAEDGLASSFVAACVNELRMAAPAIGAAPDTDRTARAAEQLQRIADAMRVEGVRAALHPHVGTWIETEAEVRAVLDTTDDALALGADLGHLAWAGVDVPALLVEYRGRLGPVHLKDVDPGVREEAFARGWGFWEAVLRRGLWIELGSGSLSAAETLAALDAPGVDWIVVETDVPNRWPAVESLRRSRELIEHSGARTPQNERQHR